MICLTGICEASPRPRELGDVQWRRDLGEAQAEAKSLGRPLLLLFDEVPGCQTCVRYGQGVLSHPLIVELAETHFVPVAIFNNVPGRDRAALEHFGEPSWNNPVVRFVDSALAELAPRLAGDYSQAGLLRSMRDALANARRPVPAYLTRLLQELEPAKTERAYYSMPCFWSGEVCLGGQPGVLSTRAGFAEGHEVVEVRYDPRRQDRADLDRASESCGRPLRATEFRASAKDDKYQLKHSAWRAVPMTAMQRTLVNARLGQGRDPGDLLSPRQHALHEAAVARGTTLDLSARADLKEAFAEARRVLRIQP